MTDKRTFNAALLTAFFALMLTTAARAQEVIKDGPKPVVTIESSTVADDGEGAGKEHVFFWGNCTYCAAMDWKANTGTPVTWGGDAKYWLTNAAAQNFKTSKDPSAVVPKAILVFGASKASSAGHVATATAVDGGYVSVTECNYVGFGKRSTRKIKISELRSKYNLLGIILP